MRSGENRCFRNGRQTEICGIYREQYFLKAGFAGGILRRSVFFFIFGQAFHQLAFAAAFQRRPCFVDAEVVGNVILVPPELQQQNPFAERLGSHQKNQYGNREKFHLRPKGL